MRNADELIVHEFPVGQNLLYLNHAAVAPWPRRTGEAVAAFAAENVNFGAQHYGRWAQQEERLRQQCTELVIGAKAHEIAFAKNTSEALSFVAHGFPWQAGDNVVIANEEFPSNRVVWQALRRDGVEVRQVAIDHVDPEAQLIAACDRNTKLLSVSTVQYASGLRMDLARLGTHCHRSGIAFCIDAIQGLGVFAHDVEALHADFLMADGHKWLLAPEGLAIFYCRESWLERLRLHEHGWHMVENRNDFDGAWQPAKSARRFECGSPNRLGVHALTASLSLILEIGVREIETRVLARSERLFTAIQRHPELTLLGSDRPGRYAGIVTFKHARREAQTIVEELKQRGIICIARGGGVRFSPHCHTDIERLERAVDAAV